MYKCDTCSRIYMTENGLKQHISHQHISVSKNEIDLLASKNKGGSNPYMSLRLALQFGLRAYSYPYQYGYRCGCCTLLFDSWSNAALHARIHEKGGYYCPIRDWRRS